MSTKGKITDLYDIPNIAAQQKQVVDYVEEVLKKISEVKPIEVGLREAIKTKDVVAGIDALNKKQVELEKIVTRGSEAMRELDAAMAQAKVQSQQYNKELALEAKLQQAAAGSIEQARAAVLALTNQRNKLDLTTAEGVKRQQELNAEIDRYNLFITANVDKDQKRQRNIGNYSQANKILEADLKAVRKAIEDQSKSADRNADVIAELNKQEQLLTNLVESQVNGFLNATAEIKENTKALQLMAAAGLEGTDAYRQLFETTSALKDETADLKAALNNAAPDDIAFNAAADAARGLVGVYGLAQSATAILGDENKVFAETLVKLQAAETALQSIEALRAVFKKENAVLQARELVLGKIAILQTNLETAAQSKNIVVKYAAVAAQKALNFAMSAAGGPILAVIGVLALLLLSLSAFAAQTRAVVAGNKEMADSFTDYADTIDKTRDQISRSDQIRLANMKKEFATAKDIRDQETADLINQYRLREKAARDFEQKFGGSVRIEQLIKRQQLLVDDDEDNEEAKAELESLTKARDKYNEDVKALAVEETAIRVKQADNIKATTEENIKARQEEIEAYRISLQTQAKIFEDITGNEEKSYDDRIAAAKRFSAIQQELINKDAEKQRLAPGQSPTQIKLIEAGRKAAIVEARRATDKQIETLEREAEDRRRKAQLEILKIRLEQDIKAQEAIADNEQKGYGERLDAAYAAFEDRKAIIIAEYDEAVKNKKLTNDELLALERKLSADLLDTTTAYLGKQLELQRINQEQFTALVEQENQKRRDIIDANANNEVAGLNRRFAAGLIGLTKYNKERERIEREQAIVSAQEEVNLATSRVIIAKEGTAERAAAEKDLAEKTKQYGDIVLQNDKDLAAKRAEVLSQAGATAVQALEAAILGGYTRQANAIQDQIDLLEKKKQKDIEVANATIQNEQDRAAAISVIEARANAEREQLEIKRRRNEYERARTERAITIARIIADTAAAVIAALGSKPYTPANIALAAATGALGAAQLAKVIATPLPKFYKGKDEKNKYEGWAITGDGGRSELIERADGSLEVTPAKSTLTWVGKDDIIHADAKKVLDDMRLASSGSFDRLAFAHTSRATENMSASIGHKLDSLTQTIKNKRELHIQAGFNSVMGLTRLGNKWLQYTRDQTNW